MAAELKPDETIQGGKFYRTVGRGRAKKTIAVNAKGQEINENGKVLKDKTTAEDLEAAALEQEMGDDGEPNTSANGTAFVPDDVEGDDVDDDDTDDDK
jgi:hypothetical protein